jgi:O-antigen/teichoic acid export membrane protein
LKNIFKIKLIGNTAIYALANVLNGLIPFLLLPILTRVFTPEEYGLVTLITIVIAVMGAFTGLSVHGAASIKYFDKNINYPKFIGACLLVLTGSTLVVLTFLVFAGDTVSEWIHLPKQWLVLAAIASAAQFVVNIRLTIWQVQEQAMRYGFFQVSQTLFNLGLSLALVLLALVFWVLMGWEGRAWGIILAIALFACCALYTLQKEKLVDWQGDKQYVKAALKFGVPLIPHVLGGLAIVTADRFIIAKTLGAGAVGIFAVAIQISMVMNFLVDALLKSYSPTLFRKLAVATENDKERLVNTTYIMFLAIFTFSTLYIFFAKLILPLLVGESFNAASIYIAWLVYAATFSGMYYLVGLYIVYAGKTHVLSIVTIGVGAFHCVLLYYLITREGLLGAAKATVVSSALMFLLTWIFSARIYPMEWLRIFRRNSYE